MRRRDQPSPVDLRGCSDEELVGLMANLDEEALRELFRRYAPFLTAMAERMGFGPESAAFIEEVFVRLWEGARRFDPVKANARTWVVTTAHRLAVNRLGNDGPLNLESLRDPLPAGEPAGEDALYVSEALDRLDPLARQLLELGFFGGRDHNQLAEMSGRPPATVKTTMKRALASLREALAGVPR